MRGGFCYTEHMTVNANGPASVSNTYPSVAIFAKAVDEKFTYFDGQMFCADPAHREFRFITDWGMTELIEWIDEHFLCVGAENT